jgi:hypothetical protein
MSRITQLSYALVAAGAIFCNFAEAGQRSFVSSTGNDANTASSCVATSPCRSFTAAQSITTDGGEIIALDAAGYGAITITKNLSIIANPGFYAGITAAAGNAITIATAGINVVLRGLNVNGLGAVNGVLMTDGASLTIENCIFANFTNAGTQINALGAKVRVTNSTFRGNSVDGFWVQSGIADVSGSRALGNGRAGFLAFDNAVAASVAKLTVSDSVSSQNSYGVANVQTAASTMTTTATRVTGTSNAQAGFFTQGGVASTGYGMYSGNGVGIANGGGTLESTGNNVTRNNTTNTSGTITGVGLN